MNQRRCYSLLMSWPDVRWKLSNDLSRIWKRSDLLGSWMGKNEGNPDARSLPSFVCLFGGDADGCPLASSCHESRLVWDLSFGLELFFKRA